MITIKFESYGWDSDTYKLDGFVLIENDDEKKFIKICGDGFRLTYHEQQNEWEITYNPEYIIEMDTDDLVFDGYLQDGKRIIAHPYDLAYTADERDERPPDFGNDFDEMVLRA